MPLTFEAIYENGVLKPVEPLPLKEHDRVRLTLQPQDNWVDKTYGIIGWKGSAEEAEYFASDAEFDYPPPPEDS